MKLVNISISNYKGLRSVTVTFDSFSCFVGENNAGKSSILQSVNHSLSLTSGLSEEVFYDSNVPIEFVCALEGITDQDLDRLPENHRTKIKPLIEQGNFKYRLTYKKGEKLEISCIVKVPRDARLKSKAIEVLLKGRKGPEILEAFDAQFPEFVDERPNKTTQKALADFLQTRIDSLEEEEKEDGDIPLPTGINSSLKALLPEAVYIPAVKNFTDDMKTTQGTSFGRILGLLMEDIAPSLNQFEESLKELEKQLNVIDGKDSRNEKVIVIEKTIESYLKNNFPNVRVDLAIPPPQMKTILSSAQIYLDDGSRDLIENKGDGIKRSLVFALLQTYVGQIEKKKSTQINEEGDPTSNLIFLFEEPELYLHPKSQRILFSTLERISQQYQVSVTTHSPIFFEPGATATFTRIAKYEAEPKPIAKTFEVNFRLDQEKADVFKLAKYEHTEAGFFNERLVLIEGESDEFYLKRCSKLLNPSWDFETKNVGIVKVGGKSNFVKFKKFYEAFGITCIIVADLDFVFEGITSLDLNDKLVQLRNQVIASIDQLIGDNESRKALTSKRVRKKVSQGIWLSKYEEAKETIEKAQNGEATAEELANFQKLFVWEKNDTRVECIKSDQNIRSQIVPLLDSLRSENIVVLSKGEIEDYYPEGVPGNISKPERAIRATSELTSKQDVCDLWTPLVEGRSDELSEILELVFQ